MSPHRRGSVARCALMDAECRTGFTRFSCHPCYRQLARPEDRARIALNRTTALEATAWRMAGLKAREARPCPGARAHAVTPGLLDSCPIGNLCPPLQARIYLAAGRPCSFPSTSSGEHRHACGSMTLDRQHPVRFGCVGCGACCRGRYVPLTLAESQAWLRRGDEVAILLEAFLTDDVLAHDAHYDHYSRRASEVPCGTARLNLIPIFVGVAQPQCPNLDADDRCTIHTERPLVCRIYPMEINPFIAIDPANKECPPESWSSAATEVLIASDARVDPALAQLIEESRAADRRDAAEKVAICQQLGYTVTAYKGNGLALYRPERERLFDAVSRRGAAPLDGHRWTVEAHGASVLAVLQQQGVQLIDTVNSEHLFLPLGG